MDLHQVPDWSRDLPGTSCAQQCLVLTGKQANMESFGLMSAGVRATATRGWHRQQPVRTQAHSLGCVRENKVQPFTGELGQSS